MRQERWFSPDADIARRPGEEPQQGCQVRRFLPFGDGSRKCIGGELGRVSLTATLARIIGNFRFSLADQVSYPVIPSPSFPLKSHCCHTDRHWKRLGASSAS
jgi:cytochrome P450